MIQTLSLSGSRAIVQKQSVVTDVLPKPNASTADVLKFFKKKRSWLRFILDKDLEISRGFNVEMSPEDQLATNGETELPNIWTTHDLPRELLSGSITDWMERAYTNLKTGQLLFLANFKFVGDIKKYTSDQQRIIRNSFPPNDKEHPNENWFRETIMATNAQTRVYSRVTSFDEAEEVPQGLAQALWSALNTLHHEGTFTLAGEEIDRSVTIGCTLNLTGGCSEWAAMNAQVQEVTWIAASGQTIIRFGPPEHLSPQDMIEHLRGIRQSAPSLVFEERTTGKGIGSGRVYGSGKTPASNSQDPQRAFIPFNHPFEVIVAEDSTDTEPRVKVYFGSHLWHWVAQYGSSAPTTSLVEFPISGLDTSIPVSVGGMIWLRITVSGRNVIAPSAAEIMHEVTSGAGDWGSYPSPFQLDTDSGPPYHRYYHQLIANCVEASDPRQGLVVGNVKILQRLNQNLLCTQRVSNGLLCLVPEFHTGSTFAYAPPS